MLVTGPRVSISSPCSPCLHTIMDDTGTGSRAWGGSQEKKVPNKVGPPNKGGTPVHNEANRQPTVNQQLNSCPASTTTMKNPILWEKIQAFWIWEINNTQKYAQCAHGVHTDQTTPPISAVFGWPRCCRTASQLCGSFPSVFPWYHIPKQPGPSKFRMAKFPILCAN